MASAASPTASWSTARPAAVQGERPWSPWKVAAVVILGLILAAVAGYFYAQGQ